MNENQHHNKTSRRVRIAAAAVVAALSILAVPEIASAATTDQQTAPSSTPAPMCKIEEEKKVVDLDADRYRERVVCTWLPAGVQAGWYGNWDVWTSSIAVDGSATSNWSDWGKRSGVHTEVDYRVDPTGPGTDCTAEIVKTRDVTFGYDEHAVKMTCTKVASGVKVRGTANYSLETDTHTEWLTGPGTVQGPGQVRNVPAMPTARVDYELR